MTELDLINLARSATANEVSWFTQVITINFAMIVGIYYFLSQARIALRIFSFFAYTIGMLVFLGEMLIETNVKYAAITALKALPQSAITVPAQIYIGVNDSWLSAATSMVFNSAFWVLWTGILYLMFFGKGHLRPAGKP